MDSRPTSGRRSAPLRCARRRWIYATTPQDDLDFNLAYIGPEFVYASEKEQFETAYMKALYDYGYRLGRAGSQWRKLPPGLLDAPAGSVTEVGTASPRTQRHR